MFTRQSLDDPAQHEVVALAPWHAQLWLVDDGYLCTFYDRAPTRVPDEPTSIQVPQDVPEESIATLRQFSPEATALLTDLTKARPLFRTELNVKNSVWQTANFWISRLRCDS
jgi:hypothetical protein